MKKQDGFTLVELLVTIALMLTVLGIAIVSIIKISDTKKEESYRLVKDQIITAAEQYFSTNSYYFENLTADNIIKVSLGRLVDDDYLNVTSNPITGRALNKCSYVKVSKKSDKINYEYIENADDIDENGNCAINSFIDVEPVIIFGSFDINPIGTKGDENWYKKNENFNSNGSFLDQISEKITNHNVGKYTPGVAIELTAIVKNSNYYIKSIKSDENEIYNSNIVSLADNNPYKSVIAYDINSYAETTDGKGKLVTYTVEYGEVENPETTLTITKEIPLKVDVDPPMCEAKVIGIKNSEGNYICYEPALAWTWNGKCLNCYCPSVSFSTSDLGSGIKKDLDEKFYNGTLLPRSLYNIGNNIDEEIIDVAGNVGRCKFDDDFSLIKPSKEIIETIVDIISGMEFCGNTIGNENWSKTGKYITQIFTDIGGNETQRKKIYANDEGNVTITSDKGTICTVPTKIDKTPPKLKEQPNSQTKRTISIGQYSNNGSTIKPQMNYTLEPIGNNTYEGWFCSVNKSGYASYKFSAPAVVDTGSGLPKSPYKVVEERINAKNKKIDSCLRTRNDNPCIITYKIYATDNVGNQALIETYKVHEGYINNGVSGGNYQSWCNGEIGKW